MSFVVHAVEFVEQSNNLWTDRLIVGVQNNIANAAAQAAGDSVEVDVAFKDLPCDANGNGTYGVIVTPSQDCRWHVDSKTGTGFKVHLVPATSSVTLVAGTVDVLVVA